MASNIEYDPGLLTSLRGRLGTPGDDGKLTGFLVPHAGENQSEDLPPSAERLTRLTGFTGSAGLAVVLTDQAAIFVDGRYTLAVVDEVDTTAFEIASISPLEWLQKVLKPGDRLGYDAWLHTPVQLKAYEQLCKNIGVEFVAVSSNLIDALWPDQPAASASTITRVPEAFTAVSSAERRKQIAEILKANHSDATVLGTGDAIAWLFNIRASDVSYSPLVLGFAIVYDDGHAQLFVKSKRVDAPLRQHLGDDVEVCDPDDLGPALDRLGSKTVQVDPGNLAAWIVNRLTLSGAKLKFDSDPSELPRACKTETEIAGVRTAHVRDGAALVKFLSWLEKTAPAGNVTELSAVEKVDGFRAEDPLFRGVSFPTISGAGPHGAIVHYRVSVASDRALGLGELYLCDSGGQYPDGTTDVTRTVAIGTPTAEMKDRFTRVLKGHIAISSQIFPKGTSGRELDILARRALWEAGIDYNHGTGHGVGTYLCVHEGPQRIAKRGPDTSLQAGMVISNEPGYYKAGAFGIRLENLIEVVGIKAPIGAECEMLGFRPLTLAPFDLNVVEVGLLDACEKEWLNAYHDRVRVALSPALDDATQAWLEQATGPI